MIQIILDSDDLQSEAEWKAYPGLGYNFKGHFMGKECTVTIVFENQLMIITVTTPEEANRRSYYSVGERNRELLMELRRRMRK